MNPNLYELDLTIVQIPWGLKMPTGVGNQFVALPDQWLIVQDREAIAVITQFHGKYSLLSKQLGVYGLPCCSIDYAIDAVVFLLLRNK